MDLQGKNVTVVGLARSGFAAAMLLKKKGAIVRVTDSGSSGKILENASCLRQQDIEVETGGHSEAFLKGCGLVVTSPGVPPDSLPLSRAASNGIRVISEVELGYMFCRCPIVAVTGSNGKSTVVTLISLMLQNAGRRVVTCGNIGKPFSGEVEALSDDDIVVLEVSSFQLDKIRHFRPKIAVLLNITENHIDRHGDIDSYLRAKMRIFENQGESDWAVLNDDDRCLRDLKSHTLHGSLLTFSKSHSEPGAFVSNGKILFSLNGYKREICSVSDISIKGEHNLENALASVCACSIFEVNEEVMARTLAGFAGLEHRFEYVGTFRGVRFINDSKATSVAATEKALLSCKEPVILIAGGRDKGVDFSPIRRAVIEKVKALIVIGESKGKLLKALHNTRPIKEAQTLEESIRLAYESAQPGDCVLLSPMCASFDMFSDFEQRGRLFKEGVYRLCEGQGRIS
jgi:UDP-N-acetylmuramoylalanine--D-glutamate ligase